MSLLPDSLGNESFLPVFSMCGRVLLKRNLEYCSVAVLIGATAISFIILEVVIIPKPPNHRCLPHSSKLMCLSFVVCLFVYLFLKQVQPLKFVFLVLLIDS